mmetsp:Transcript_37344/g.51229  ORF Transcript_37344/g.51229 Transcript_37344/m.51229 type:complete len:227 (+) Transcript_37344:122-802(+)
MQTFNGGKKAARTAARVSWHAPASRFAQRTDTVKTPTDGGGFKLQRAGRITPAHSPKPRRVPSEFSQVPLMTILSPSSKNLRTTSPPLSLISFSPAHMSSSKDPKLPSSVPEIVPVPSRSPGRIGQPLIVWCASCCASDQYMYFKLLRMMVSGADISAVCMSTSSLMSKACLLPGACFRYGSGSGLSCEGVAVRNGSRAARGTTHGEMVVPKFLPRNGPRGTISHF